MQSRNQREGFYYGKRKQLVIKKRVTSSRAEIKAVGVEHRRSERDMSLKGFQDFQRSIK